MEEKNNHTMIWDKEVKYTAPEKEDLERTRDMFAAAVVIYFLEANTIEYAIKYSYDVADAAIKEKQRRQNICNVDETTDR